MAAVDAAPPHVAREGLAPYASRAMSAWPDEVRVAPPAWIDAIARGELPPGLPLARSVVIDDRLGAGAWLRALARSSGLGAIRSLRVQGRAARARDLDALSSARSLSDLRHVALVCAGVRADHVTPLLDPGALGARLERLEVVDGALGDDRWWTERARTAPLTALRVLRLEGCGLAAEHFDALARAPWFSGLESLCLRGCEVGDEAMRLWRDMRDPGLAPASLDLSRQSPVLRRPDAHVSDRGVAALCDNPAARGLVSLDLSDNVRVQDKAAAALASSPHLHELRHLRLTRVNVSPAGWGAIAASDSLALETLTVSEGLDPASTEVLSEAAFRVIFERR